MILIVIIIEQLKKLYSVAKTAPLQSGVIFHTQLLFWRRYTKDARCFRRCALFLSFLHVGLVQWPSLSLSVTVWCRPVVSAVAHWRTGKQQLDYGWARNRALPASCATVYIVAHLRLQATTSTRLLFHCSTQWNVDCRSVTETKICRISCAIKNTGIN